MRLRRLVVLRALKVGDLVTAVPALRALARAFPMHERVLAAPAVLTPLAYCTQAVDRVVDLAPLAPLPEELDAAAVAVNLHGRGPESSRALAARKPERLIAFRCAEVPATYDGPVWRADEHEVDRWCRLLNESGITADPADRKLAPPPADPPSGTSGATVVHPGASAPARRWPAERFAAVARAEMGAGRRVVITGNAEERSLAVRVAEMAGLDDNAVLAGSTTLAQLAATVMVAGRICSGDTGVAHLATAYGTPSVVLFGPVSPAEWGPPTDDDRHRALWAGRTGDPHGDEPDPGLLRISVDDVVCALQGLPERTATEAPNLS